MANITCSYLLNINKNKDQQMNFEIAANGPVLHGNENVCDKPTPLTNFDGTRYMGVWYE